MTAESKCFWDEYCNLPEVDKDTIKPGQILIDKASKLTYRVKSISPQRRKIVAQIVIDSQCNTGENHVLDTHTVVSTRARGFREYIRVPLKYKLITKDFLSRFAQP